MRVMTITQNGGGSLTVSFSEDNFQAPTTIEAKNIYEAIAYLAEAFFGRSPEEYKAGVTVLRLRARDQGSSTEGDADI
jgi:hypothetical protein